MATNKKYVHVMMMMMMMMMMMSYNVRDDAVAWGAEEITYFWSRGLGIAR